jgi:hypothetical protein
MAILIFFDPMPHKNSTRHSPIHDASSSLLSPFPLVQRISLPVQADALNPSHRSSLRTDHFYTREYGSGIHCAACAGIQWIDSQGMYRFLGGHS